MMKISDLPEHLQKSLFAAYKDLKENGPKYVLEMIEEDRINNERYEEIKVLVSNLLVENQIEIDTDLEYSGLADCFVQNNISEDDLYLYMDKLFDDERCISIRSEDKETPFYNETIHMHGLGIKAFMMMGQGTFIRVTPLNKREIVIDIDDAKITLSNN